MQSDWESPSLQRREDVKELQQALFWKRFAHGMSDDFVEKMNIWSDVALIEAQMSVEEASQVTRMVVDTLITAKVESTLQNSHKK